MFEKIVVQGSSVSIGDVAEALLFYQNVHLILDSSGINALVDKIGMPGLLSLLARCNVSAVYVEELLSTHTRTAVNGQQLHSVGAIRIQGDKDFQAKSKKERLAYLLHKKGTHRGTALKLAERFFSKVPLKLLSSDYFVKGGIPEATRADFADSEYLSAAIRAYAGATPGFEAIAKTAQASVLPTPHGFILNSNIDFAAANSRRKLLDPSLGDVTEASILCSIQDARAAITFASHYGGEFYTSENVSRVVRLRFSELLKRSGISANELQELHDVSLPEFPRIRDVINSGSRSFDEFVKLLDKSDTFRTWIHGVNPDAKLVHEYVREVTSDGWIAKLPVKAVRYAIATAIGVVQPVVGAVLSAADAMVLEKLLGGWRPSHFVEGHLKPFLDQKG